MRIHEIQAAEGATETQETQLQLVDFELFVDAFELSKTQATYTLPGLEVVCR